MKISVSNIAWKEDRKYFTEFLDFIKKLGCSGVELAPSCIWKEPINSSSNERSELLKIIHKSGLEVVGFHSLLYTRPELKIFLNEDTRKATINYIFELIKLCSDLNGKQLIFGSPKNRLLHGKKYDDCTKQISEDFLKIAEFGKKNNVFFCIEPLGKDETEFIQSLDEGGRLVKKIDHPYMKLHLDTKVIFDSKENPEEVLKKYKNYIQHVHVGDQNLNEPGTINNEHSQIGKALKKINYQKYISLEMRRNINDIEGSISRSVKFIKQNYS